MGQSSNTAAQQNQIRSQGNAVQNPAATRNQSVTQNQRTGQIAPNLVPPNQTQTQPVKPTAPEWANQLSQKHQSFIVDLLDHWQKTSDSVRQYQCEFKRYDYDTMYCNWRDPNTNRLAAASIMTGEIRFAAPDKASYETLYVYDFPGPPKQEGQPLEQYKVREGSDNREKWICDGKAIFEFDFQNKKLYETDIPVEMQGKGLVNSPIPFLFGASKENILSRYWIKTVTPEERTDVEYWLEAVPKKIDDARNYKKIELVLSREDFLPVMLQLYAPNYDPKENNYSSRVFEFENRKVNGALQSVQNFFNRFVRPQTPRDWERVPRKTLQANNQQKFDRKMLERPAQLPSNNTIK